MTKSQFNKLKTLFNNLESNENIYWFSVDGTARKVKSIGNHADEPGPCANFEGIGIAGGHYVALDNCKLKDFSVVSRIRE